MLQKYMFNYVRNVDSTFLKANGLVERFNQTIQGMLVKFVQEKKETWESYIDTCIYAYNTSRHESSLFTPFELMFGRKAIIPIELDNGSEHTQPDAEEAFGKGCDPETIQKMQEDTKKKLEKAKVNIICAQQKQKEAYDNKHHQPDVYAVGALVLKKDFTRKKRKGGKLDSKWVGPYKIAKALGKGLYRLEDANDPSKIICRVNGVHLKPYNQPSMVWYTSSNSL